MQGKRVSPGLVYLFNQELSVSERLIILEKQVETLTKQVEILKSKILEKEEEHEI